MLVLSRRVNEQVVIGNDVVITVQRISGNRITLGIEAPRQVRIRRGELDRESNKNPETDATNPSSERATQLSASSAGHLPPEETHVAIASGPLT